MLSIIACISQTNRAIGYQNRLLYHIKCDLTRFRELTTGHAIIMGRKTYESLPHGALPHRRNIVVSHNLKELEGGRYCRKAGSCSLPYQQRRDFHYRRRKHLPPDSARSP